MCIGQPNAIVHQPAEHVHSQEEHSARVRRLCGGLRAAQVGDCIAFEAVEIATPAGVQLVKDLSFRLEHGESLLLLMLLLPPPHHGPRTLSWDECS